MPLAVHLLLHPDCPIKPAWAVFDAAWYLRVHADARVICAGRPPPAALGYYLRVGAKLGHSPSPLFDELFYLNRDPDIAELVRTGRYHSGFDHYCQHGHRGVSPHWLFDDALYGSLYEDMSLDILDEHQCYGRYDHYLRAGQREERMAQFLFDGPFYTAAALAAGVHPAALEGQGPYVHFLYRLASGEEELAPSVYFDPAWYLERHPAARAEIARGRYHAAIHHYLTNESASHFDPVPEFSEIFYRRRHPDIAAAIDTGAYRCGYQQFVQHGAFELRQPSSEIDLVYYRDVNERVRNDLNAGAVRDAFAHLRLIGLGEGLPHCPVPPRPVLDEAATRALFLGKARANLASFAHRKLDFACAAPVVSVIMVLFNRFELTMLALGSLHGQLPGGIELIIVDNASDDATRRIGAYVTGARIIRLDRNTGFLHGANAALAHVTAPALLYLNNDVELGQGALAAALARLAAVPDAGAICGKIIRTNGCLQEAGSIIWNEGTVIGYMRDADPLAPEANFVRAVDYGSAVFLLCRTGLVRTLHGFDPALAPAYYEDADLCVRMIEAGWRVLYDPGVIVHHFEFGSAASSEASMALMRRAKRIFKKKQKTFLATRPPPSLETLSAARSRDPRPAVLFIEDLIPLRRLGSGFVRSNDIVHALAAGHQVHVYPLNYAPYDAIELFGDFPGGVEVLYDRDALQLPAFLEERAQLYDAIWIARTHNLPRVLLALRQAGLDVHGIPLILDTEAVESLREAGRAALKGEAFDLEAALVTEFAQAGVARATLGVSAPETALLRRLGLPGVARLGTARAATPTSASFAARADLLFVAAIHRMDSPNLDALAWYVADILPALIAEMGAAPILHVVGYAGPDIDLSAFAGHPHLVLHGPVGDLATIYDSARLCIAPARFAAGTPYKLYEAAAFGVPSVATSLLVGQLGWTDGVDILGAGDAQNFARRIARLYRDAALWQSVRSAALARVAAESDVSEFNSRVERVMKEVVEVRTTFCEQKVAKKL